MCLGNHEFDRGSEGLLVLLEEEGINKIILLTHIGYENDIELASMLSGADVIVGGHTHSVLGDLSGVGLDSEGI